MKIWYLIGGFFVLALVASSFFFLGKSSLSPISDNELEVCNSLIYNSERAVDIVFFSDEESASKYVDYFLETSPFDENKNKFNFYYINSYQPECERYKGIALLCYSRDLIKKATSCPNDYIVTLMEEGSEIRSSSYMNVMSVNTNSPMSVFIHEFGHAFAGLAEEYVPAKIPKNQKNCVNKCENFDGIGGCFEGCSDSQLYRSVDNGVMRTLKSDDFGEFNKKLILEKLDYDINWVTGFAVEDSGCEGEFYVLIEGEYVNGEVNILSRSIEEGCVGNSGEGSFSYSLILDNGDSVVEGNFNAEMIFTDGEEGGEQYEDYRIFFLKIPFIKSSDRLDITDPENVITSVDLSDMGARACRI